MHREQTPMSNAPHAPAKTEIYYADFFHAIRIVFCRCEGRRAAPESAILREAHADVRFLLQMASYLYEIVS